MVYAKNIGSVEVHHVLDFLSVKGVATMNSSKWVVTIIFHIPTNPSINEQLKTTKTKAMQYLGHGYLIRYPERLGENTLHTTIILTQKSIVLLLLLREHIEEAKRKLLLSFT